MGNSGNLSPDCNDRTVRLLGDRFGRLEKADVLVVGLGGVGGYCLEVLARAGIGRLTLVDGDRVDATNLNRQLLATTDTVGRLKTEAAAERVRSIDPRRDVRIFSCRFDAETCGRILDRQYDYAVDAIDSVRDKVLLITECVRLGIPILSAMGAGNRLDDEIVITDVYRTKDDGLARAVRTRLKKAGINSLKVAASVRPPIARAGLPASISYPPAVMGCKMGGEVIRELLA